MAKAKDLTGEVYGVEFYVDENWMFVVPELDSKHKSYELMCEAVTRKQKAIEKSRVKLDLECVNDDGEPFVITGVHAGNGRFLDKPPGTAKYTNYPNIPWIVDAIKKAESLQEEAACITDALRRFQVNETYASSRGSDEVKAQYEKARRDAEKTTLEAELKRIR